MRGATTPPAASDSDLPPPPRPMGMEMGMPPGHSFDKDRISQMVQEDFGWTAGSAYGVWEDTEAESA